MDAITTSKYVGVHFQGKGGSLIISAEKVVFRPKLTATEKSADVKPVARSWRWASIDRVEVLDPGRATKQRSLKLKSKVAENRAVTLTVPQDILDDIVQDMNKRLSSSALGVEGIISPAVRKELDPAVPKLRRSSLGASLVHTEVEDKAQASQKTDSSRQRRASMSDYRVPSLYTSPIDKKKETKPSQEKPLTERTLLSTVSTATLKLAQPIQKLKTNAKDAVQAKVKAHSKFPLLKPPEAHRNKPEPEFSTEDEMPLLQADSAVEETTEDKPPSPTTTTKNSTKRPLLHFLKPPPPRRNISNEFNHMQESLQLMTKVKTTTNKPKPKTKGKGQALSSSSAHARITSSKKKQQPKEKGSAITQGSRGRSSMCANPSQRAKPKAAVVGTANRGSSWTPSADALSTPPTAPKEKVQKDIFFTPPEQRKPSVTEDIVFTPSKEENRPNKKKKDEEGDDTSASTCPSDTEPAVSGGKVQPPQSPLQQSQLLWNPEAPEHKFRTMVLQHAASCRCGNGSCPYDPTCSEYKTLLAHIVICEDEECTVDRCRTTKQFLLTMHLMNEITTNEVGQQTQETKDFLVGVGALAPVPVIQLPMGSGSSHHGKMDNDLFSVISDSTWWSHDWGALEGNESD